MHQCFLDEAAPVTKEQKAENQGSGSEVVVALVPNLFSVSFI